MIDVAIELVAGFFGHKAKKRYYLCPDEIDEPIREQSLCSIDKISSLLVLTDLNLMIFKIQNGKRILSTKIPVENIKKCKRDFWSKLIIETETNVFSAVLETPKKWEKLIEPVN
jgi:hypothetical protein